MCCGPPNRLFRLGRLELNKKMRAECVPGSKDRLAGCCRVNGSLPEGLEGLSHVVQRLVRIPTAVRVVLAHIAVNAAHLIDRFRQLAMSHRVAHRRWLWVARMCNECVFCVNHLSPLCAQ